MRIRLLIVIASCAVSQSLGAQSYHVARTVTLGGNGGWDYLALDTVGHRLFIARQDRVLVVSPDSGTLQGEIDGLNGAHGVAFAYDAGHGFATSGHDSTVTMFDLKTLAVIKKIKVAQGGLDGIMFDAADNLVILTNHSRPIGTVVALNPADGSIKGAVDLADAGPEGAAANGKGKIYVNLEGKNAIQVVDIKTMKSDTVWDIAPCDGPTGIAYDAPTNRIFAGCGGTSVVVNGTTGKVVAQITNGDGVDALGYDPVQKLIYIPAGRAGNVTVVHQDSADKYTTVATVTTFPGAKTIAVDAVKHVAYLFQPEYGPPPADAPPPQPGQRGRGPRGPMVAAWFIAVTH